MATWPADWSPAESGPRARRDRAAGEATPPVLPLSHFCAPPFLCFGDVRVGGSRTRPLVLYNPHEEALRVELLLMRAADRGFSGSPSCCELQPKEKLTISINWTPLKEGRVREIVTFLVNDILKHQAILLGNAEHKKKKRSLWNSVHKKKAPASSHHKRTSKIQSINETFSISQKIDRVRSPLQACENMAMNECCSPTENNFLHIEDNKIPTSPISPAFKEYPSDTCLPLFLRRSTAYSSLHVSENVEQLKVQDVNISKDFNCNEEVITETLLNSINISGQSEENNKLILTPSCSSPLNIQSQRHFLSPDSFVNNSHAANNGLELVTSLSSDTCWKDNSKSLRLESQTVHEVYQRILSPDSFLNDNYGLNKGLISESVDPTLSPTQFAKDDLLHIAQQTCIASPLSDKNSHGPQSSQHWRRNEIVAYIPECSETPEVIFEEQKPVEMKSNNYAFRKHNHCKFSEVRDGSLSSHNKQPKRRPILSATVTKRKPTYARENQPDINNPKAKRCLKSAVAECEKAVGSQKEKEGLHSCLPVIKPISSKPQSYKYEIASSTAASVARKRKSDGKMDDANGQITVVERTEVCEIKRIHFSTLSTVKKTKRRGTPISKCSQEKLSLKKNDSLVFKTPISKIRKRTRPIVAVAQSNLTFIKPLKTDIPRHPMPFAAKNMFYDERWKEKQEQGFTWWLNYMLTPDDFTVKTNVSEVNAASLLLGVENQHKISVPRAPTKDEASLRAYTAGCRLNRLRRTACCLFTSEKMVKAIKKLEIEIEVGRLIVRKDRHLWKDIGNRQKVLNWLLSYNPLWLRIGLETVYGELIPLADNSDVTGLAMFIVSRLLWNPDIAAEYSHPTVPHLYRVGHEEALSKFTLKKLLLLVCFLDYAKLSRLIDHDPCLFCKDSEFKASKDLLLAFSRDFLSGEGDLSRHLSVLGLPVSHVQTPLDEFDFAVTNLAVDLQCGVRLVRTMELLTQNWNLSKKLRIPAISRLQKMHNVDIVLQILKARGIQLSDEHGNTILSKDIVDRHREKTLGLLWKIAFAFQVDIFLNLDQLKEEIDFLKHTYSIKKEMSALYYHAATTRKKDQRNSGCFEQYSQSVKLLMEWVNAVCAFYNKKVENFTVSFSDGRVLCYLIHHYHPCYVPFDAICQRTTQSVACTQTGSVVLNSSSESDGGCLNLSLEVFDHENTPEVYKELLENEKKNFHLVRSAVKDLGGIPAMIHHSDMSNTIPDEKVVITYLSFLCARLLDLRKEIRAARLIQTAWRKYKVKKDLKCHQERDKAARVIQSAAVKFLTRRRLQKKVYAALVIQKYWRRISAQRKLIMLKKEKLEKLQNKSASLIQAYWRKYSIRKRFLELKHYSVILQSRMRMILAVTAYKRYLWAIVAIQRRWRACLRRKQDQQRYQMLKSSSLIIQAAFRRWKRRKLQPQTSAAITLQRAFRRWHFRKQTRERSATVIQSWYRMHRELQKYIYMKSCVVIIQRRFRCVLAQKLYKRRKESTLTIQKHYRAYRKGKLERSSYLQKRAAAIRLQAAFREMKARRLHRQIRAACVLQSYWRTRQERFQFLNLKKNVIKLQAHIRKYQQLQKYKKLQKAAVIIQTRFRASISARKVLASYQKTRSAAIVLQSACRGIQARKMFRHTLTSVIKIQSYYRAYISRKKFHSFRMATIKLQSVVKMKQTRKQYLHLRSAALVIQQWYRSQKLTACKRKEFLQARESCIKLQAFVRGCLVRKQMRLQRKRKAAVSLQSYFRMRKVRQQYLKIHRAVVVIQKFYHAYRAQVTQRKNFLQVRRAAVCLQAAYRGYRVRQLVKQQSIAALKIQTAFRGYSKRLRYQSVLQSAVKIQRWYRVHKTVHGIRMHFLKTRVAVISLQSACRGWRVRKQLRREHQAAVEIQSTFRMARARKQFKLLKAAAVVIQQHLRAWTSGKKQRLEYIELRRAVLLCQAAWKGKTLRRQIQRQHKCAIIIQSYYRMHVQQRKWKVMRKAALEIQIYYRAYSIEKEQHHLYLKTKAAVVILQSAYRGMKVRKRVKAFNKAAVAIQSKFRAYTAQKKYADYRASAIVIQRWYRNIKVTTQQHKEYLNLKKTVVRMQAVYRGVRVRRRIQQMHMAATLIKAMFKMHQSKVRYHTVRRAAVIIQVRYRAYYQGKIQREKYLRALKAIQTLQAGFRGARVRKAVRRMHAAATLIQSHFRRYRQKTYFNKLRKVTKLMQQRYRAVKERNVQFQRYNRLKHSAIHIQAAFRGLTTRRHLKVMHLAATLIQRRYRMIMMRRKFLSLKKAVIWIQRKFRAKHHLRQLLLLKAALKIQSSYRGWVVRKKVQEMHRAATVIQAAFRMHRAHVRFQVLKRASVVIQKQYQAHRAAKLQRQLFIRQRQAAMILQAAFRGMKTRNHLKTMHSSATLIQSRFRSLVIRRRFLSLKRAAVFVQRKYRATVYARHKVHQFLQLQKAAIIIQSSYRRLIVKKQLQKMHRAAVLIQATFRMHRAYVRFHTWKSASILIQHYYRAYRTEKLQREKFARQWNSAVIIQAAYKGMKARQLLKEKQRAAVIIQRTYRMYRQCCFYQKLQWAAETAQEKCRSDRERQKTLQHNVCTEETTFIQASFQNSNSKKEIQKHEAAFIQKHFKAFKVRRHSGHLDTVTSGQTDCRTLPTALTKTLSSVELSRGCQETEYHSQNRAAVLTQKDLSKRVSRKLEAQKCAALQIQSFLRMAVHRRRFVEQKRAVVTLQQSFRTWRARKQFVLYRKAAVVVQSHYRAFLSAKYQRELYLQIRRNVVIIQARIKGFIQKRKFQKIRNSAIKIQALWRGYSWRKKNDCTKMKTIRQSLGAINKNVEEENKLYKRTTRALHHLLTYKHLSAILDALKHLEVVTRLSPLCCENMAKSGAISEIFVVIRSCNRSVPCMEVINYAVQVLLNVAKYEKTTSTVYDAENCIDTLLELLQMYREKPGDKVAEKSGSIFTKTCCLLAVLLKTTQWASEIRNRPKVINHICSIYKFTAQKHKMNTERIPMKRNSCIGFSYSPERPVRTRIVSRLRPHWVLRQDTVEEITNSLQAIQMVMDTLGIPF